MVTALIYAAVVFAGALVARSATRYAAELHAAQRRRDAEIAHLSEFRDALVEALTSFGTYKHVLNRLPEQSTKEATYENAVHALEQTVEYASYRATVAQTLERLRNLARGLLWTDLREEFRPIERLVFGAGSLLQAAIAVDENMEAVEALVERVAAKQRELLEYYPVHQRSCRLQIPRLGH